MYIGFDYGTANCSVAVMDGGQIRMLPLEQDSPYLPSMLCAPTRDAVSECLHRHWHIPTGSDENQRLLQRAVAANREEDIHVDADSLQFGLQALHSYNRDPQDVYFVKSPKSFLGANGLKEQQIALFEDLVCAMMAHIRRRGEASATAHRAGRHRPSDQLPGSGGDEANAQAQGYWSAPRAAPDCATSRLSSSRSPPDWTLRRP